MFSKYNIKNICYIIIIMSLFIHSKNQELLWNAINKTPLFKKAFTHCIQNEPEEWFKSIIHLFYYKNYYKSLSTSDLTNLNQEVVAYMINQLKSTNNSTQNKEIKYQDGHTEQNTGFVVENKHEMYNRQFNERQKDYETMVTKPVPPVVDFTENIKDEAISNMDELIKLHREQREAELKQFAPLPVTNIDNTKPEKVITKENITIIPDAVISDINADMKMKKNVSWSENIEKRNENSNFREEIDELKTQVLTLTNKFNTLQEEIQQFIKIQTNIPNK